MLLFFNFHLLLYWFGLEMLQYISSPSSFLCFWVYIFHLLLPLFLLSFYFSHLLPFFANEFYFPLSSSPLCALSFWVFLLSNNFLFLDSLCGWAVFTSLAPDQSWWTDGVVCLTGEPPSGRRSESVNLRSEINYVARLEKYFVFLENWTFCCPVFGPRHYTRAYTETSVAPAWHP